MIQEQEIRQQASYLYSAVADPAWLCCTIHVIQQVDEHCLIQYNNLGHEKSAHLCLIKAGMLEYFFFFLNITYTFLMTTSRRCSEVSFCFFFCLKAQIRYSET